MTEEPGMGGDVIIFVHGWGLSSKIWREQTIYFSKKKRVISIDLPGHGTRKGAAGPYTVDRFTNDLKGCVENLGIKKPVMVGASLGGMVVLNYLLSFPGDAGAAVLVGSTPCFLKKRGFGIGIASAVSTRLREQLLKSRMRRMEHFYRQIVSGGRIDVVDSAEGARRERPAFFDPPSGRVLLDTLKELEMWDIRDRLREIDLPTLIIHGEKDSVFSVECAGRLGEIRRARIEIVRDAGHLPFLTGPEQVNKIIEDFIRSAVSPVSNSL